MKAFMVGSYLRSYGTTRYEIRACATAALGCANKHILSDGRAARRIPVFHIATSCVYLLPPRGRVGRRGFSLPARVSSCAADGAYPSLLDEPEACSKRPQ